MDINGATHTYTSTFAGWDTYQEASVTGVSTDTNYRTTTNTLSYDAYGRLVGQRERTHYSKVPINDRQRYYAYTGDGLVQLRREREINKDTGVFEQKADSQRALHRPCALSPARGPGPCPRCGPRRNAGMTRDRGRYLRHRAVAGGAAWGWRRSAGWKPMRGAWSRRCGRAGWRRTSARSRPGR